jgi:peptidyl-prolyl cis-trans isomerase C
MTTRSRTPAPTLLLALLLGACGGRQADDAAPTPAATPTPGATEAIAWIGDEPIDAAAFTAYLDLKQIDGDDPTHRARALDAYLEREALARTIAAEGLLEASSIDAELAEFRRQMLISRYFERFLDERVGEQAVRNHYAANQAGYSARKARVAHVLIRTNAKMTRAERDARLTKTQEAYSRIRAGEAFAAIAAEYSEDRRSADNGGEIGWLGEGAVDPAFSAATFGLQAGEVSPPVATPFGFHVIKLLEGPEVRVQPFERVKGDIRYQLRQQAKQAESERLRGLLEIRKAGPGGNADGG